MSQPQPDVAATTPQPTSEELRAQAADALGELIAGNRRFVEGRAQGHSISDERRAELLEGQSPRAVVLGCVDSRVPPEIILDQEAGDLLTVRTAGQSLAGVALGSIEFGVRVLGIPLVVVLGHTGCGAVLAALRDDDPGGHLGELTGEVAGRLVSVVGRDPVRATGANLLATVDALRAIDTLVTPSGQRAFVVGVLYDMATGHVAITDAAGLTDSR